MKIETLRKNARASAKWRGHAMKKFIRYGGSVPNKTNYYSECKICRAYMIVNLNPAPNEIDIGGSAVAINCKGRKK